MWLTKDDLGRRDTRFVSCLGFGLKIQSSFVYFGFRRLQERKFMNTLHKG